MPPMCQIPSLVIKISTPLYLSFGKFLRTLSPVLMETLNSSLIPRAIRRLESWWVKFIVSSL